MTALAADIGGTRIKLGVVRDGECLASGIIDARSGRPLEERLPAIESTLRSLCASIDLDPAACDGIGIGFPALVDTLSSSVLNSFGKFVDAPSLDLPAWSRERLGLPLVIDNDARVALLGEWKHGAGRDCDNLAIITLGTGIGTAVLREGVPLRGPRAIAGNNGGHIVLDPEGRPCVCGGRGCVEAETGTLHLPDIARAHRSFPTSRLARADTIDYAELCASADAGDPLASELLDRATAIWGVLCVNLIQCFDLDRVVLGGGIMTSASRLLPPIRETVSALVNPHMGNPAIVAAEHPDLMAVLGCEVLVRTHLA